MAMVVALIKLAQGWVDATPLFFFGDSQTYIHAAVDGIIPICRSFTYGWLIRGTALLPGDVHGLVVAQIVAGGVTAWLVGWMLLRYGRVRPGIALAASVIAAFEPLGLLHERLVMAETFTLLLVAVTLLAGLAYMERPRLWLLLGVVTAGFAVISLRLVYLPLMTLLPLFLIGLMIWIHRASSGAYDRICWLGHLAAALMLSLLLHMTYRAYVGKHFGGRPAYQHMDGLMLLGAWTPLLLPSDTDDPRVADVIRRQAIDPVLPLFNHRNREAQIWVTEGLVERMVRDAYDGKRVEANAEARRIVRVILKRDPVGILQLGATTWLDYVTDLPFLRQRLVVEQGFGLPLEPAFKTMLQDRFRFDGTTSHEALTPARVVHRAGARWYQFLALSPILVVVGVFVGGADRRPMWLLLSYMSLALMMITCLTAPLAVVRYLHPISLTALISLGLLIDECRRVWVTRKPRSLWAGQAVLPS